MARGERRDADYFPFYCKEGSTMKYIESNYGNDGFAVWVKILRELTTTSYHFLNLSNRPRLMVFTASCRVSEDILLKIINDLVELGEFDSDLWKKDQIIWSDKFIESIQDAYKNRKNKIVKREEFIRIAEGLIGKKLISEGITSVSYPQTKEEKSKEEKTKADAPLISSNGFTYDFSEQTEVPREANLLIEKIAKYFSVTTDGMNPVYNTMYDFVVMVFHRGQFKKLAEIFEGYTAYKARSQESKHGPEKWMGTRESYFKDGAWITTDWISKNKNYEQQGIKGTSRTTSAHQVGGTQYGTNGGF